jgi:hypothetical protein
MQDTWYCEHIKSRRPGGLDIAVNGDKEVSTGFRWGDLLGNAHFEDGEISGRTNFKV